MKKLLLVLLVVTLASFLFVGCFAVPNGTEGEGEGEGEAESVCPTVALSTEVDILGDKYIKGGSNTITVTFTEATEPVSVYVSAQFDGDTTTRGNPVGVPDNAIEVVMSADADMKVYTGKYTFKGDYDCDTAYVYVVTCATCAPCKFAYTVDNAKPCSSIRIYEYPGTGCSCGGVNVRFVTPSISDCAISSNCGDACTELDTYKVDIYKADPYGTCCDVPCLSPIASCEGIGCEIDCTVLCLDYSLYWATADHDFYVVATLADKVGNTQRYYATLRVDTDEITAIVEYNEKKVGGAYCADWTSPKSPVGTSVSGYGMTLVIGNNAELYGSCE
jgi:hypothetical protein